MVDGKRKAGGPGRGRKNAKVSDSTRESSSNLDATGKNIYTIGHGTRSLDEVISILEKHSIKHLVDIRSVPRSRHNPQFNTDALPEPLAEKGICYHHFGGLGGLRHKKKGSPASKHTGLQVDAFRNYADYMSAWGAEFLEDYEKLQALAREEGTCFFCAETKWWSCHRRMVSDRLSVDGWDVYHLGLSETKIPKHTVWDVARVDPSGELVYDQKGERRVKKKDEEK